MSSEALSHEEAISQFCGVTGANEDRAKGLLEACDWNLELAINMHVDTDDGRGNKPSTSNAATSNSKSANAGGPSTSGSKNQADIIDISDSIIHEDDEDDNTTNEPSGNRDTDSFRQYRRPQTARRSRPISSPSFNDVDDVRPPIPPVRQVLVRNSDGYSPDLPQRRYNTRTGAMSDVYDAFRDFQAEAQWQEMAQDGESSASDSPASNANKRTLQELFRPPLEIMFRGSLATAREAGTQQNKWLLVNIQNCGEFACQILNRDVWSNQTVKDIIKEHFLFWQVYHDSFEGSRYTQFYQVKSFPHVSIIDPRTGEQMKSWPVSIDHNSFCDSVIEFLTEHSSPDGSSDANSMKKLRVKEEDNVAPTLYDQSEEAQLEAAIRASLQETTENSNSSKAFADEDSYTDAIESDNDQTRTSDGHMNTTNNDKYKSTDFCGIGKSIATSNNSHSEGISNNNSAPLVEPKKEKEVFVDDYKKYLGVEKNRFTDLNIKFPDGTRDQVRFPSDSLMKALFLLLTSKGYGMDQYNYVTLFPRRLLHELHSTTTLQHAQLFRETIIVERRASD